MAGIASLGLYVPRYFVAAADYPSPGFGVDEVAIPGFDEDEVTMAVVAGEKALLGAPGRKVDRLTFASAGTRAGAVIVGEALGVDSEKLRDVLGVPDAGEEALAGAIAEASEEHASTLVAVSHASRTHEGDPDAYVGGAAAVAIFVTPESAHQWTRGPAESSLRRHVGDVGAVSVFLPFLESLDATKGIAYEPVASALDGRVRISSEESVALQHRKPRPPGTEYSQGAYVSLPAYQAEAKARYRLVGEQCATCGRTYFPPRESCLSCGGRTWKEVSPPRTGLVYAYTIIGKGAAPSEFLEQQLATGDYATAIVELDDGLRLTAMLADVDPARVHIGMRVRMVFRRIYAQEGVVRYGFKFAPG